MGRRSFGKVAPVSAPAAVNAPARDSFANFEARVGLGTGNQAAQGRYSFDFISRNRIQLEAAYRSSWICGMAVDAVAEDMTRAGIELSSDIAPTTPTACWPRSSSCRCGMRSATPSSGHASTAARWRCC